jgi:hypothetical protein
MVRRRTLILRKKKEGKALCNDELDNFYSSSYVIEKSGIVTLWTTEELRFDSR